jgi:large subunit ribosomal protein L25
MTTTVSLAAESRHGKGKGAARQLRMQGKIPAVIYGRGREPQPLAIALSDLEKTLAGHAPASTVIDLSIDGKTVMTVIREVQHHPVRRVISHVDFYEIHAGEKITLEVPLHLEGSPDGVRNGGGVLDQVLREIRIEVLPRNIPERVELDVTDLGLAQSLNVKDIHIENAIILNDPEATVCSVIPPRVEEAPAPAVVEEEEAEEPELIRKPKAEEEEGEGAGEEE